MQSQLKYCISSAGISKNQVQGFFCGVFDSCITVTGTLLEASRTSISSFREAIEQRVLNFIKRSSILRKIREWVLRRNRFFTIIRHCDHRGLMFTFSGKKRNFSSIFIGAQNEIRFILCLFGGFQFFDESKMHSRNIVKMKVKKKMRAE